MALAWKAGWVHALTSSNLVSSASTDPALTRGGIRHFRAAFDARATPLVWLSPHMARVEVRPTTRSHMAAVLDLIAEVEADTLTAHPA